MLRNALIVAWAAALLGVAACGDDDGEVETGNIGKGDGGERDASSGNASERDAGGGDDPTVIAIADGRLQGASDGESVRFLGIPFAEPPVGELRWKAPQKNAAWKGTRDATEFGGRCAQLMSIQAEATDNEDCLYLNVWKPAQTPSKPAPVLFWIHGGGNTSGSTSDDVPLGVGNLFYNGRAFAEKGVVVVTTNYRLGALGFFSHAALRDEGGAKGNQGLLDQQMALRWVHDNIAKFGGDPKNVTVFGESAGSLDTCFHVASPSSRGLFQRAISESGGCTSHVATLAEAESDGNAFVDAMGCADEGDVMACMREVPASMLTAAAPIDGGPDEKLPGGDQYQGGTPRWRFRPTIDGEVLPDQPRALFDDGDVSKVPYILGSNFDEGTLFHLGATPVADEAEYRAALERRFGPELVDMIVEQYPVADFASADAALQRVSGDVGLVCGTYDSALRAADAGLPVYMYDFALPIAVAGYESLGAVHGAEIAYVFADLPMWPNAGSEHVSDALQGYWSRFARSGDPNGAGAAPWPRFSADKNVRLDITEDAIDTVEDFRAAECAFWRTTYDD